ncbi:MAG: SRPBCC family protein [Bryobacteraceae bacterium]
MSKLLVLRGWKAVLNIHERRLPIPIETGGRILDSLSSGGDLLWPREQWPPMVLDGGLAPGSCGGHSGIRYAVSEYVPGRRVEFEFRPMARLRAFRGRHYFEVLSRGKQTILRHSIDVDTDFATWLQWKLVIEHLHDALMENAFDKAERSAGVPAPHRSGWPIRVRFLRWLVRRQARQATGRASAA